MGHELSLSPLHIYVSRTLDMNYTHGTPLLDGRMKVLRYNTNFHELSLSPTRIYASRTLDMHYTHGAPILDGRVKILRYHTIFHVQIKFYASPHTLREKKKHMSHELYMSYKLLHELYMIHELLHRCNFMCTIESTHRHTPTKTSPLTKKNKGTQTHTHSRRSNSIMATCKSLKCMGLVGSLRL